MHLEINAPGISNPPTVANNDNKLTPGVVKNTIPGTTEGEHVWRGQRLKSQTNHHYIDSGKLWGGLKVFSVLFAKMLKFSS